MCPLAFSLIEISYLYPVNQLLKLEIKKKNVSLNKLLFWNFLTPKIYPNHKSLPLQMSIINVIVIIPVALTQLMNFAACGGSFKGTNEERFG